MHLTSGPSGTQIPPFKHGFGEQTSETVSFKTSAGMIVGNISPLDGWPKSPDVRLCVMTLALVIWLMSPEVVVSMVSVFTTVASVLKSPLAVSLT